MRRAWCGLVMVVAACGEDAPVLPPDNPLDAQPLVDAAPPHARLRLHIPGGPPATTWTAVFQNPDGSLLGTGESDAAGEVVADVPDGSTVTVFGVVNGRNEAITIVGLHPDDDLQLGEDAEPPAPIHRSIEVPFSPNDDGYRILVGCVDGQLTTFPSGPFALDYTPCAETMDAVIIADAINPADARAWVMRGVPAADASTFPAEEPTPQELTLRTFELAGLPPDAPSPQRVRFRSSYGHTVGGAIRYQPETDTAALVQHVPEVALAPANEIDSMALEVAGCQELVVRHRADHDGSTTFEPDELLPIVTVPPEWDGETHLRWEEDGHGATPDTVVAEFAWIGHGEPCHRLVFARYRRGQLSIPPMPGAFAEWSLDIDALDYALPEVGVLAKTSGFAHTVRAILAGPRHAVETGLVRTYAAAIAD